MRGALVLFLTLYLLRALVAEANSALSGLHVWLFAGGLYVAYSALMPSPSARASRPPSSAGCSATPWPRSPSAPTPPSSPSPTPSVYNVRERLQREETASG
jgi:hypothetical protein